MNRAARSIRSGSSLKDSSGDEGRAEDAGGEVGGAAERIDQLRLLPVVAGDPSAMALTVKSRRARSASTSSAKATSGLRESGA